jgi:hypothetical protein
MKDVNELQLDGLIVKKSILDKLNLDAVGDMKLEYAISMQVQTAKERLVYSPDFMLYKQFPGSMKDLLAYIRKTTRSRAAHWKSKHFAGTSKLFDLKYALSLLLLAIVIATAVLAIVYRNLWFVAPLGAYYLMLWLTRVFFWGFGKGTISFLTLVVCQLYYGVSFFIALFVRENKTE